MTAPDREKAKLLKRLNRIRGQVEALRRASAAEELIGIVHSYRT
jgi:DNA-binding FrmR family transcriptional regulator